MKTISILFYLLALVFSAGAFGTPLNPSQDKPFRLYVESYDSSEVFSDHEREDSFDDNTNYAPDYFGFTWWQVDRSWEISCAWFDGSGGNGEEINHKEITDNFGAGTNDSHSVTVWSASSYPDVASGHVTMTGYGSDDYDEHVGSPIIWEHCDIKAPVVDETDSAVLPPDNWNPTYLHMDYKEKDARNADAVIKLQTGGKAKSKRQNLIAFNGSANRFIPVRDPFWHSPNLFTQNLPVPPQDIQIMGESLDTNGNLYLTAPDNIEEVVTPIVKGVDYYTFSVSATKYKSYFQVFVCQPDPSPSHHIFNLTVHAGHAWWKLWTDAPNEAVSKLTLNNVNLEYLGVEVGYGPTNNVSLWNPFTHKLDTAPGEFPWPNTDTETTNVTYQIGFWDLISGLNYAEGLKANPGTYTIPSCDCVSKTRECGSHVGIALPSDNTPEFFGFDLPPTNQ